MSITEPASLYASSLSDGEVRLVARCLTCQSRQTILRQLGIKGQMPLEDLQAHLRISAATLSHHLERLERAGLIEIERTGRRALLKIRRDVLLYFSDWLADLAKRPRDTSSGK